MTEETVAVPFVADEEVPSTSQISFLSGAFDVGAWRIPYFATTLSFREAANDLRLTNEMPGQHWVRWTVSELYQRDLDWNRVQNDLLRYLSDPSQPQFFNSITIALYPYMDADQPTHSFGSDRPWAPPKLTQEQSYAKLMDVGPIRLGWYSDWGDFSDPGMTMGRMRWNTDQVHGVAIDGQHRLAAIKEYVRRNKVHPRTSRVPVLLLLLDRRVGFVAPGEPDMTSVMRTLFIDLNKHAKVVSRARTILLDDRDPTSRCVRAFLSNELAPDLQSLSVDPPRMPLSLVDWHSEEAKFDRGPYIATVLGVDWTVGLLLGHKPIVDMMAYSKIEGQIRSFAHRLNIDLQSALDRLADVRDRLIPFSFTDEELDRIADGFSTVWSRALTHLLTEFRPYQEFVSLRASDGSTSLEWQMWYRLREGAKGGATQSVSELEEFLQDLSYGEHAVLPGQLEQKIDSHDAFKRDNFAFNVAFQRAYIAAFAMFFNFTDADLGQLEQWCSSEDVDLDDIEEFEPVAEEELSSDEEQDEDEEFESTEDTSPDGVLREMLRAQSFVRHMNRIVEVFPGILQVDAQVRDDSGKAFYFWAGSLRNAEAGIDFAQGASVRAGDLLYLCVSLAALDEAGQGSEVDFDSIWQEITDTSEWAPFKRMYWASRRCWNKEASLGGRILSARQDPYDRIQAQNELERRLRGVWEMLRE